MIYKADVSYILKDLIKVLPHLSLIVFLPASRVVSPWPDCPSPVWVPYWYSVTLSPAEWVPKCDGQKPSQTHNATHTHSDTHISHFIFYKSDCNSKKKKLLIAKNISVHSDMVQTRQPPWLQRQVLHLRALISLISAGQKRHLMCAIPKAYGTFQQPIFD